MRHNSEPGGAQRRPSTIIDDTEPLLAAGGDSNFYRTISVSYRRLLAIRSLY